MTSSLRQLAPQPAYAPPRIPIEGFRTVTHRGRPSAWWLFLAGMAAGWVLHALIR